jgi:hypothetical protein
MLDVACPILGTSFHDCVSVLGADRQRYSNRRLAHAFTFGETALLKLRTAAGLMLYSRKSGSRVVLLADLKAVLDVFISCRFDARPTDIPSVERSHAPVVQLIF